MPGGGGRISTSSILSYSSSGWTLRGRSSSFFSLFGLVIHDTINMHMIGKLIIDATIIAINFQFFFKLFIKF